MEDRFAEVKEWYDGYRFGNADVYCPWDVINFVDRAKDDKEAKPEAYWINTSGNDLVKRFIDKANKSFAWISRMKRSIRASKISGAFFLQPGI